MKCELCHKADAETAITRGEGDAEEELYVCNACAKAERQRRQKKSQRTRKVTGLPPGMSMSITRISGDGDSDDEPPPILGAIMNAFQDMVSDLEKAKDEMAKLKIATAVENVADRSYARLRGVILNHRNVVGEDEKVRAFADSKGLEIVGEVPRSDDITRCEDRGMTTIQADPDLPVSRTFLALAEKLMSDPA